MLASWEWDSEIWARGIGKVGASLLGIGNGMGLLAGFGILRWNMRSNFGREEELQSASWD